jgi:hypothetical protein
MSARTIELVLAEYTDRWMAVPGVVGTAIGESGGRPCILVFVADAGAALAAGIPGNLEGHPIVVEQTGEFEAL